MELGVRDPGKASVLGNMLFLGEFFPVRVFQRNPGREHYHRAASGSYAQATSAEVLSVILA